MKTIKKYMYKEFMQSFIHNLTMPQNRILILFTIEGMLITLVNNIIGFNNNLFATRLGASDFELSLVITLPQLVGMLVLIPGGILTDRLKNKRSMVIASLFLVTISYLMIGFVPALGSYRLVGFLVLLAISTGPMTIYNVAWQAYFSDVVDIDERNNILTYRTAITFLIGIVIPLASGALLASAHTIGNKILIHQIYFFVGGALLLLQIFVLKQIKSNRENVSAGIDFRQLKTALQDLIHNRKFLGFVGVAMFFYITWHIDWTMYFIGQVKYLKMNEAWLSYASIGNAVVQFLTLGFWSRLNVKRGVRFVMIFGNLGLAAYPIGMIISTSVPQAQGKIVFVILNTLASVAMAVISLNVLQCLLQVIPEKNKTLNISIYTVLVTLSNAVMPLVGVWIYKALGGDLTAFHILFWGIFIFRVAASGLWTLRYFMMRHEAL